VRPSPAWGGRFDGSKASLYTKNLCRSPLHTLSPIWRPTSDADRDSIRQIESISVEPKEACMYPSLFSQNRAGPHPSQFSSIMDAAGLYLVSMQRIKYPGYMKPPLCTLLFICIGFSSHHVSPPLLTELLRYGPLPRSKKLTAEGKKTHNR
jgi:hypothetical protein